MKKILAIVFGLIMVMPMAAVFVAGAADIEPNNSFSNAMSVEDGDTIYGSLDESSDYEDYYRISLDRDDQITIIFSGTGDDFDLILYDNSESLVADSTGAFSFESIWFIVETTGTHYIVPQASTGSGDYTLSIVVTPGNSGGNIGVVEGTGPGAQVPVWTVGNSWSFGKIVDLEKELKTELDKGLKDLDDLGFDTNLEINGGLGVYLGVEVIDDDVMVNGYECYNVEVTGGFGIDLGIEADIDGSLTILRSTIDIDVKADGFAKGEIILEGNIYFTTDQLAIAKIDLTVTAELKAEVHIDATVVNINGNSTDLKVDAEIDMDDVEIDFLLSFDPPIKLFDFPIKEGDVWYVPHMNTTATGVLNARGTITTDISLDLPNKEPEHKINVSDLATDIGDNNFYKVLPGGPEDHNGNGGRMFKCTQLIGDNIYIIESSAGDAMGFLDMPGTRAIDPTDPTSVIGDTASGVKYDSSSGFITGATINSEVMTSTSPNADMTDLTFDTETVTMEEVKDFTADPQGEVIAETGGADGGSLFGLLLLVIIVVVVVLVIVVVVRKNKKPQQPQYAPPPQQQYAPQQPQYYEQPPAPPQQPPQEYPPQDQQPPPPPQEYPPQDQQPPPPPQG